MSRRKVATTVYITRDQDQALKLLAERTGVSAAQYIREGIDLVIDRHKDNLPLQLSFMEQPGSVASGSGPRTASLFDEEDEAS